MTKHSHLGQYYALSSKEARINSIILLVVNLFLHSLELQTENIVEYCFN